MIEFDASRTSRALRGALVAGCLLLVPADVPAQTLPLPDPLVALDSEEGARMLAQSEVRHAYLPLSMQFVTQKNQAYCGVATLVMVLNALGVPAPATPDFEPFKVFTQDNLLNSRTDAIVRRRSVAKNGMTLEQLGRLFEAYSVAVDVRYAGEGDLDEFRDLARRYLETPGRHVVVNYLRSAIGQETGGHISPLGAYDEDTDRFLILDVSRYKYPPVWVAADDLFAAMDTPAGENRTRGYVLVGADP